tara:strand:- start:4788 stop:5771 length:984 start_codon:yes stop_codon:yes gene_type:complete
LNLKLILTIAFCFVLSIVFTQPIPANEENIPFLVTFGSSADPSFGDDDYCQTFFFSIPEDYKKPFYIRIFDPDVGGLHDELNKTSSSGFNTVTKFSLYGGAGCISEDDSRNIDPVGKYKSGNLIVSKSFSSSSSYDGKWISLGPFNPAEGELEQKYYGYVFKLIAEGIKGDDGNLYKYFLSSQYNKNVPIEGGNSFTFEYSFRLPNQPLEVSHIYPFVNDRVVSVKQSNFDLDNGAFMKLFSSATLAHSLDVSGDNEFAESLYYVKDLEKGKSLDIQFIVKKSKIIANNNLVFYITNQYGESLPFFSIPIGGVPKYQPNVSITPKSN